MRESNIEAIVFHEIERTKYSAMKTLMEEKEIVTQKLNLIDQEYANIKAIREDLESLQ